MDFAEAQREVLEGRKCGALCRGRTRAVFGEGPLNAELFIVGEAPGFNEDKEGKPFQGASGMLLDRLLFSVGLEREEVYLTTLVKCRPPEGRPPKPAEINACRTYLLAQLAAVDPKSGKPMENPARNIWINATALSTALNTAYFAESVATFSVVMGLALLLTGIGFLVVTFRLMPRARD